MESYDVVTIEDEKVGHVVDTADDLLIVEQGTLRKSKHALPREFAEVDEARQRVLMTVSKDVFSDSPKINGEVDRRAIAEHYGLVPATAVDPGGTAEEDAKAGDVETAPEERLRTRAEMEEAEAEGGVPAESPALLGDRYEHTKERDA